MVDNIQQGIKSMDPSKDGGDPEAHGVDVSLLHKASRPYTNSMEFPRFGRKRLLEEETALNLDGTHVAEIGLCYNDKSLPQFLQNFSGDDFMLNRKAVLDFDRTTKLLSTPAMRKKVMETIEQLADFFVNGDADDPNSLIESGDDRVAGPKTKRFACVKSGGAASRHKISSAPTVKPCRQKRQITVPCQLCSRVLKSLGGYKLHMRRTHFVHSEQITGLPWACVEKS